MLLVPDPRMVCLLGDLYAVPSRPYGTGYWKRGKGMVNKVKYRYSDLFIRLREGKPPKHYYSPKDDGHTAVKEYIEEIRKKRITYEY